MSRRFSPTQILIDQSSEAALVHERGVVVMANPAAARLLRFADAGQLVGRDVASVLCLPPERYGGRRPAGHVREENAQQAQNSP